MITGMEHRAREFAFAAHAGQLRKYTNENYIVHPAAVAELVRSVPHTEAMICAAWLHDTVEDCGVELVEINEVFGLTVANYVAFLSDVSKPLDGNRETRKALDREHVSGDDSALGFRQIASSSPKNV
jgi:(p)ppGpp synthase/HD superfamily hydrolase